VAQVHTLVRRLLALVAGALLAVTPATGAAQQTVVTAVVAPTLGWTAAADGRADPVGTVDFSVTREQFGCYEIVTITPR